MSEHKLKTPNRVQRVAGKVHALASTRYLGVSWRIFGVNLQPQRHVSHGCFL